MSATDRELLERAAKAAGIEILGDAEPYHPGHWVGGFSIKPPESAAGLVQLWNPLTDDGDALRLASKLRLRISLDYEPGMIGVEWFREFGMNRRSGLACESHGDDRNAALRRTIVRAAAALAP